jgi:hypothetical protein
VHAREISTKWRACEPDMCGGLVESVLAALAGRNERDP